MFEMDKPFTTIEYTAMKLVLVVSSTCFPLRDNEQHKIPGLQKSLELDSLLHLIWELVA